MRGTLWASAAAIVIIAAGSAAAAPLDDTAARLAAIERENALLRQENAVLRQQTRLQRENAKLREQNRARPPAVSAPPVTVIQAPPSAAPAALPDVILDAAIPAAYGPDTPIPLKSPVLPAKGEFKFFVEGGVFRTGGDPLRTLPYDLEVLPSTDLIRQFDLRPKNVGGEGAIGFDYRFVASPWHVSAQFRYGEVQYSASDASSFGPTLETALCSFFVFCSQSASTQLTAANTERHWLADFAVGRDLWTGPDAMQVKFGVRVVELDSAISQLQTRTAREAAALIFGPPSFVQSDLQTAIGQNTSFRGVGPRVGVDGAIPLPAGFEFDYLAGAAALFGTRRFEQQDNEVATLLVVNLPGGSGTATSISQSVVTDHRVTVVGNVDLQAGLAYWVMPNFKIGASYRLDAYFGAFETLDASAMQPFIFNLQTYPRINADRYFHTALIAGTVKF